jgi:tetratricopeptide (TPR) repeat protein
MTDWLAAAYAALSAAEADQDPGGMAARLSLGDSGRWRAMHDESIRHYEAALPLCRAAGWSGGLAAAYNNVAILLLERREARLAAGYLREAAQVYREMGDLRGVSRAVANLALVSKDLGRLREAVGHVKGALAFSGQFDGRAIALNNLANLHRLLGEFDAAIEYGTLAIEEHRRQGNWQGEAVVLDTQAQIHRDRGAIDLALALVERARRLIAQGPSPRLLSDFLNTLGSLQALAGRPEQALATHREALEANQGQIRVQEIQARAGIGAAYLGLGRYDDGLAAVHRALDLAREVEYRLWEGDALTGLAEIHAARGDDESAERYAHDAHAIHLETGYWLGKQRLTRWFPRP